LRQAERRNAVHAAGLSVTLLIMNSYRPVIRWYFVAIVRASSFLARFFGMRKAFVDILHKHYGKSATGPGILLGELNWD